MNSAAFKTLQFILALAALSLLASPVHAYVLLRTASGAALRWRSQDFPLLYQLNDQTTAALPNITDDSSPEAAIEGALQVWKAVASARVSIAPLAYTDDRGVPSSTRSLITFLDTPENRELVGDALATTSIDFKVSDGTIVKTTTVFNPRATFSTTQATSTYDIQAVATHELGHTLGAGHTGILSATMFQTTGPAQPQQRTLSPDDAAFLSQAYPGELLRAFGSIHGRILYNREPIFGAHVVAHDDTNAVLVGAVTLPDGTFEIKAIPPGRYLLYVEPLDSPVTAENLTITKPPNPDFYRSIKTTFPTSLLGSPETPASIEVREGEAYSIADWNIVGAAPTLNIARAGRSTGPTAEGGYVAAQPFSASPGQIFLVFLEGAGIYERISSPDQVRILGSGVRIAAGSGLSRVTYRDGTRGANFLVEVSRDATAGPRTLLIRDGNFLSVFAGGLRIEPVASPIYTLRFPFLSGDSAIYTGIALANTSSRPATFTCTAYTDAGLRMAAVGVTNPVTMILEAGNQAALLVEQILQLPPGSAYNGWLEVTSDSNQVTGFYLVGDRSLEYIDGTDVGEGTSGRLLFPGVIQSATFGTEISLVNPSSLLWANATLLLYGPSGQLLATITQLLAPRARLRGTAATLFGVANLELGHIEAQSDQSLLGGLMMGDALRADSGSRKKLAAFRAQTIDSSVQRYFVPQYLAGGGYTTLGFLTNPNAAPVTVRVSAFSASATALSQVLERRVAPHATLSIRPEDLGLSDAATTITAGYLRIETSGGPVAGGVLYEDTASTLLAGVPILSNGVREAYFSQVAVGVYGFYTGIACLNVGEARSPVEIIMYDALGHEMARGTRMLSPGARFSELLDQLTGFRGMLQGGYFRILSQSPVISFGLVGTANTLASVPAQVPGQ